MKTSITLITLSFLIMAGPLLAEAKPDDGYALYTQACEYQESLGLKWDSPLNAELHDVLNKGGVLGTNLLALIQQEQKAFSLISDAHHKQSWQLPDISTFSADTKFPCISSWRLINLAATAQAIQLYLDGRPQDALSFLVPFNVTGLKVSKAGTLIHVLVNIDCRSMQYPVLASSIDELPEAALAEELVRAKKQYEQIPTVCESIAGEQYMAINAAKGFFADLETKLKPDRKKMLHHLKEAGIERQTLERIETDQALSVSQWEAQVLADLSRIQSFYTNVLNTRPSPDLHKLDDEIEKEVSKIGSGLEYDAAMATWNLFITEQVSGSFSMPEAERIHLLVGKAISHQFLSMIMPAVGAFGLKYREFIASERLLLIRIAVRLYRFQHGQTPSTLQQLVDEKLLDPTIIIDPLSGTRFLTKKDIPPRAYSVGRDLDDDNGIPWDNTTKSGDTILIPLKEKWRVQ